MSEKIMELEHKRNELKKQIMRILSTVEKEERFVSDDEKEEFSRIYFEISCCDKDIEEIKAKQLEQQKFEVKAMTAEQMFADLGYNKCNKLDWAIFFYKYSVEIAFYFKDKTFAKYDGEIAEDVTLEELKAINKQCEELGWL